MRPGRQVGRRATVRRSVGGLFMAVFAPVALSPLVGRAGAEQPEGFAGQFSGRAVANGMRMTVDVVNSATRNPVDGGGPTAQATLDSAGASVAYASHPFPGEIPLSGPGAFNGVVGSFFPQLGQLPTAPAYPFYVEARHPFAPHGEASTPGQALEASSTDRSSEAKASSGFGTPAGSGGFTRAASSVVSKGEGVVATAESRVVGLTFGPLTLGQIVSTATMTLRYDGVFERVGDISAQGVTVANVPVALTEKGLAASGSTVPLPKTDQLNEVLKQARLTVSITPREDTPSGVLAPAVKVVQEFPNQTGSVTYLVGSASANLTGSAAEQSTAGGCVGSCDSADGTLNPSEPPSPDSSVNPPTAPGRATPAVPDPRAANSVTRAADFSFAPATPAPTPAAQTSSPPPMPAVAAMAPSANPRFAARSFAAFDTSGLYPLLLGLAGLGFVFTRKASG